MNNRRRSAVLPGFLAVGLALSRVLFATEPAYAADCDVTVLTIVAHQDDDLLFMNPDLENDLISGACATTVFVTAGDAGSGTSYWQERELGPESAYATMLGLDTDAAWTTGTATFAGHDVHVATSPGDGTVSLISMRLPDGALSGQGTAATGNQSLSLLRSGGISTITAVDGSASYTSQELVDFLKAVIADVAPDTVRIQDARSGQADHPDHLAAAQFTMQALIGFTGTVQPYRGYNTISEAANVTGSELTRKTAALLAYAEHDGQLCSSTTECPTGTEALWLARQYHAPLAHSLNPVPGTAAYDGPNLARNASILASSEVTDQEAIKAVDSIISGWPANGTAEWSTDGQSTGAWIELHWATAQTIDRVILYDRPNNSDHITGATLTFDDGTTVDVGSLNNDGTATTITFTPHTTTTLRLTITSTSTNTANIGLAEIETYNGDPNATPTTTPTPTTEPTTTATPTTEPTTTPTATTEPTVSAEPTPTETQTPVPGTAAYDGPNLARNASILASSEVTDQEAIKAVDSIISGWPANGTAEWSTDGQSTGAWIELHWATAQTIDRVILYDRPNNSDHITGATLTFDDGTTVDVGSLNNDGTATTITFTPHTTTTLRLTITSTSTNTANIGLAEIETYNGDPAETQTPVPGTAAYDGPNLARNASILASSEVTDQEAIKAVDSIISGWPANGTAEWSTDGQSTGAWIELHWATAQTIDRVILYDRPNNSDHITGATLTFDDGTTVDVGSLNNDGTATTITFTPHTTTTLRLTITSTSTNTANIGLAEIETYNGDPNAAEVTATPSSGETTVEPSATGEATLEATAAPSATTTAAASVEPSSPASSATAEEALTPTPSASEPEASLTPEVTAEGSDEVTAEGSEQG